MATFILTRIRTEGYDRWRALYEQDVPRARERAVSQRVFRLLDEPDHVVVFLEFATEEDARESRRRLVDSGVLDRFADVHGPNVVEEVSG
jgi:hypothetical protein